MDLYAFDTQRVMETISRHCPQAMSAYIQCVNRADDGGTVYFSKEMIDQIMSEEFRVFKRNIKSLAREDLLEWHPIDGGIAVTLAKINNQDLQ